MGLGNRQRGDDGAGLEFLAGVERSGAFSGACFVPAGTNPENHLQQILSAFPVLVIFIDACRFGGLPGEIRWLEKDEIESAGISTHAYSITMIEKFLNLERKVECRYLGIQPGITETGAELSGDVRKALLRFFEGS